MNYVTEEQIMHMFKNVKPGQKLEIAYMLKTPASTAKRTFDHMTQEKYGCDQHIWIISRIETVTNMNFAEVNARRQAEIDAAKGDFKEVPDEPKEKRAYTPHEYQSVLTNCLCRDGATGELCVMIYPYEYYRSIGKQFAFRIDCEEEPYAIYDGLTQEVRDALTDGGLKNLDPTIPKVDKKTGEIKKRDPMHPIQRIPISQIYEISKI